MKWEQVSQKVSSTRLNSALVYGAVKHNMIMLSIRAFYFSPLFACFLVELCFSVVYCCTYSFVSGHTVCFLFPSLIMYFVIRPLGHDFVQIIIYHIISYHIISYHIISYHIISYHIPYHIIYHIMSCITCKHKIGINWNCGNKLFMFMFSDSCHKKALLKSLTNPLSCTRVFAKVALLIHASKQLCN